MQPIANPYTVYWLYNQRHITTNLWPVSGMPALIIGRSGCRFDDSIITRSLPIACHITPQLTPHTWSLFICRIARSRHCNYNDRSRWAQQNIINYSVWLKDQPIRMQCMSPNHLHIYKLGTTQIIWRSGTILESLDKLHSTTFNTTSRWCWKRSISYRSPCLFGGAGFGGK